MKLLGPFLNITEHQSIPIFDIYIARMYCLYIYKYSSFIIIYCIVFLVVVNLSLFLLLVYDSCNATISALQLSCNTSFILFLLYVTFQYMICIGIIILNVLLYPLLLFLVIIRAI